jgi:hypothetical protein
MNDFLEENGIGILIGVLAIGALITQLPSIKEGIARQQSTAQVNKARLDSNQKLSAEKLSMQSSRDTANSRYDEGCEVVTTLRNTATAAPIQEGQPIVAGAYAAQFDARRPNPAYYIGRDVTVCDLYGTTAIMRFDPTLTYAVASSVAVTNDRGRMAQAQVKRPGMQRPNLTNQ